METLAVRLYGKDDLRLEKFELPELKDGEILASIESNSICMSSYKATKQGEDHKRVPKDVAENPIIIGHEFCGTILEVGSKWADQFKAGEKYSIQPALSVPGRELEAPGYSFQYIGGNATKIIIPEEVMERNCLLPYAGEAYFKASLSEPVSCIIGAFNTSFHYKHGTYNYKNGIVEGGAMAILAGAGPMGLGAIDYAIHGPRQPKLLVVTDIDTARLDRAASIFSPEEAAKNGVTLKYVNTMECDDAIAELKALTGKDGFDDVMVFAPVPVLVEQADQILGYGGCLNFFAGPSKQDFKATINFYDVHYADHHIVGSSGGNTDDMNEALDLMAKGKLNPAVMITHIGGINSCIDTIKELPNIPGGKKLLYTNKSMPLTAIDDFAELGRSDPFFAKLADLAEQNRGLWSDEAEKFLLENAPNY
jgi:threonine dehydrogenase-like Zn-dependent dehydrogenase